MLRYRLKELLRETGTSQRALALGTGLSKTTINDLCKGGPIEKIDVRTLLAIADYFGIDWRLLIDNYTDT